MDDDLTIHHTLARSLHPSLSLSTLLALNSRSRSQLSTQHIKKLRLHSQYQPTQMDPSSRSSDHHFIQWPSPRPCHQIRLAPCTQPSPRCFHHHIFSRCKIRAKERDPTLERTRTLSFYSFAIVKVIGFTLCQRLTLCLAPPTITFFNGHRHGPGSVVKSERG